MADSRRKQVIDALVSALNSSTGITTATDELKSWYDYLPHQFNVVTVIDRDTDINRLQFYSTGNDKEAIMNVTVRGYVQDNNGVLALKRTNLIRDIQNKLESGTTLTKALIWDIEDMSIETDDGLLDNYSVFDINYKIDYHYNHALP